MHSVEESSFKTIVLPAVGDLQNAMFPQENSKETGKFVYTFTRFKTVSIFNY